MSMNRPRRAVVIGAGPAGLATTIALRKAGVEAVVYERGDGLNKEGTGLTLWPNGFAALDAFGAGDAVRAVTAAAAGMAMRSCTGRVLYDVSESAMDSVGGNGMALHRTELLEALFALLDPDTVRFGARCVGICAEPDRVVASFADGSDVTGDLLVGADGIRSAVRTEVGLGRRLRYGGFTVWRATIPFPLPLFPGLLSLGGPDAFGIWRLACGRVYWFASAPSVEGALPSRPPDRFETWHEPIPALLAATSSEQIVVTDIYDCRPLRTWSRGRVVLVGDAAHPTMPNLGQGTSQAFEDAAVLANRLGSSSSVEAALLGYESGRRRRARVTWSQARAMARLGGWRNSQACWLRQRMIRSMPQRANLRQLRQLFAFNLIGHV